MCHVTTSSIVYFTHRAVFQDILFDATNIIMLSSACSSWNSRVLCASRRGSEHKIQYASCKHVRKPLTKQWESVGLAGTAIAYTLEW